MKKQLLALIFIVLLGTTVTAEIRLNSGDFTSSSQKTEGDLEVGKITISQFVESEKEGDLALALDAATSIVALNVSKAIIGGVYNYPNPVRQSDTTKIGYELSKNMDIEILIYDSRAQLIFSKQFVAGVEDVSIGGKGTYNRVDLRAHGLNISELSAGIYFYMILSGQEVLGKGKMAVTP